ncbi:2334_t:CDS:2 [Funneliformis caledonium]|uniref:2334_t:CDS:1 n=1 Tax=Funneliformis caledonium TaxID=1117310 RepID=A0A9N8W1Q5_9GLOM|nr:2334_t:CDS:2 [Funneliformis caledonium]
MSSNITDLVKRPGLGRIGRPIRIRANFFKITSLTNTNIHHYDLMITPQVPPTLNRRVFSQFEALHAGDVKLVFDGRKNIFTSRPLPFGDNSTFNISLQNNSRQYTFELIIKKVAVIDMNELHRFIYGNWRSSANILTGIMALNVLIRQKPSLTCKAVGRSLYTNQISQACFGGLEVWQGFRQSVKPTPGRMMINVDVSATAFYESCNLVHMVVKILELRNIDDLRRGIMDRDRLKLERVLKNLKIRITYREDYSERSFKIIKLTNTPMSNITFDFDSVRTDIATYFQNTYNISLQYSFLPCVIIRKDVNLPLEICKVVEGQPYIRRLNERQTADMIKFSCQPPHIRANKIRQAVVPARILPALTIRFHPSSRTAAFNLRDNKVANGITLGSWSCVVFENFAMQAIQHFIRELINTCQNTGMKVLNKNPPIIQGNPQGNIEQILKQAWIKAGNMARSLPQLIFCILPNTGVLMYAEIKRVGDTVIGVATQCVQSKHIFQAKRQYYANLCLKMNVKLSGMNSFIEPSQMQFVSKRLTIIMGAHFTSGGNETCLRIAALCASIDAKVYRYATITHVQADRLEIITDLAAACNALDVSYKPTITFVVIQKGHHTHFFPVNKKDSDNTGNCPVGTVVESTITHLFEFDFYLQSHAVIQGTLRLTHYYVLYDENRFNADSL